MWLSTQTQPDVSSAVRAVARYCPTSKHVHWKAALLILGYVKRTSTFGITYQNGSAEGLNMLTFADADYASKTADRRSVAGGVIMCGGAALSWFSRSQNCVTLSTTEAEYVAFSDVLKETLLLRRVWRFILPQEGMPCISVFEDSQGALPLAPNPMTNANSKHIDARHRFIRELIGRKEISVVFK